jgi:hypothetical protein
VAAKPTFGIFEPGLYRPLPERKHREHHDVEDWDEGGQHIPSGIPSLRNYLYLANQGEDKHEDEEHAEPAKEE